MKRALFLYLTLLFPLFTFAQTEKPAAAEGRSSDRVSGLKRMDGFIPYYWDAKKGALLLELSPERMNGEFIYYTGLSSGIGSIELFADRSSVSGSQLCKLVRSGPKVLVVAENTRFRAENGTPELKHSIERSFPTSVIAALPIEAERDGALIVNANPLVVRDAAGLMDQLSNPLVASGGQIVRTTGSGPQWKLDNDRSAVDMEHTRNFPGNTEIENTLTFVSGSAHNVNNPEDGVLTVHEHISLIPLPSEGYTPREYDPRVGFFEEGFQDFSTSYKQDIRRGYIARWRLVKKDPSAALSEPVQPIVFYLDTAIPEPMRSAARMGALWWNAAFEQAGFKNALVIKDLPAGADPLDFRYPTIQWTNRSARGWSVGMTQTDPRTGEILHAVVQLDSHRMRTVNNFWRATGQVPAANDSAAFDLYAPLDSLDPQISEDKIMEERIALLTCHEMGHVLGLDHNFVASTFPRGSVMDYNQPRIKIRADGSADLSDAYMQGTGSYDKFAIEWGYSEPQTAQPPAPEYPAELARLGKIVDGAHAKGIFYGNYDDPRWNPYDDGPDPVTWLATVMPVRDALLAHYSDAMLAPGEPQSRAAARLALIYLFHQYGLLSDVNVIGSAKIPTAIHGDGQKPLTVWDPQQQRLALKEALSALTPKELELPAKLWPQLVQYENRDRDPESYKSSAGYVWSPYDGARSIAEFVFTGLLNPVHLERAESIHHFDAQSPAAEEIISTTVGAVFAPQKSDTEDVVREQLATRLMVLAANDQATPEVRAAAWAGVRQAATLLQRGAQGQSALEADIAREIAAFIRDPKNNTPKVQPSGAPTGPPI